MSATMIFLEIDMGGDLIKGDSQHEGHEEMIEIDSFNWDLNAKHTQPKPTDKVVTELRPKRVTLQKHYDMASTNLARYMAAKPRKPFKTAKILFAHMVSQGANIEPTPVLRMTLSDGFIEEVRLNASESGNSIDVKETIQLSFRKLEQVFYPWDVRRAGAGAPTRFILEQPCEGI